MDQVQGIPFQLVLKYMIGTCNLFLTAFVLKLTIAMEISSHIVILEAIFFTTFYFMKSLDRIGAYQLLAGYLLSLVPMYTSFRGLGTFVMTLMMTYLPCFSTFEYTVFSVRTFTCAMRYDPILKTLGLPIPNGLLVYTCMFHIVNYYFRHFNFRSIHDVIIGVTVCWTMKYITSVSALHVVIITILTILWIESKWLLVARALRSRPGIQRL